MTKGKNQQKHIPYPEKYQNFNLIIKKSVNNNFIGIVNVLDFCAIVNTKNVFFLIHY